MHNLPIPFSTVPLTFLLTPSQPPKSPIVIWSWVDQCSIHAGHISLETILALFWRMPQYNRFGSRARSVSPPNPAVLPHQCTKHQFRRLCTSHRVPRTAVAVEGGLTSAKSLLKS
ncbi:hypothetical protein OTU49_005288 [Cherax quadricarinatus]|uniref:Uncharacterized protein n=1 Tax=Cherax quadricarinatus TaxID=27406 RepID=A0AAW0X904_CHEQU